jgi:hypothetical protein
VRRALQWIAYSCNCYPEGIYTRDRDHDGTIVNVTFAAREFGKVEFLQALSVKPGARVFRRSSMPEEDRVLHWCSSLIRQKADGTGFEIAHFTVEEFLLAINPIEKPEFAQYRLSGDHTELSITCMTFLRYAEFDGLPSPIGVFDTENFIVSWNNLVRKCPFAAYSAQLWYKHVSQSQWDKVEKVTLDFLDQNDSDSLWKLEKCQNDLWYGGCHFIGPQDRMTTTESLLQTLSPLHWASMFALPDACKSLISERGADVNRQSLAGTPMCCAITTSTFYQKYEIDHGVHEMTIYEWNLAATKEVLKLLVAAGADFETKIDPNEKCTALLLAMQYASSCQLFEDAGMLALLHAGAWLSREHALFVLADEQFIKDLMDSYNFQDSTRVKIFDWAAETDFKFVSKDAFSTLFILALDSLAIWIDCTDDLVSDVHEAKVYAMTERFSDHWYENILPGPDGEALHNFSSEQCKSEIAKSEPSESEMYAERMAKRLSLAIQISSKNLVSSVEPAIFVLIEQDRPYVVSFLLHNGVEIDFDWVGPHENSILHTFFDRADESRLRDTILFDLLLSQGIDFDKMDSDGRHSLEIMAAPQKLSMFRKMWNATNAPELFARSPDLPLKILRAAGKHGTDAEVLKFTISKMFECRSAYRAIIHKYITNDWINDFCAEIMLHSNEPKHILLRKYQEGNAKMHLLSGTHNPLASIELMELIWKGGHKSKIDTLNRINPTPLAVAVRSKNTVAMKLLLHAGENTMQTLHNGQTVLHIACALGNDEAVKALLQSGVDVSVKDDFGYTAADVAKQNGQTRLAALIQEHIDDYLGAVKLAPMLDRDLSNRSKAETILDRDSEALDWASEVDQTPAPVTPASLDEKPANTLTLVHRPFKETSFSAEDLRIVDNSPS